MNTRRALLRCLGLLAVAAALTGCTTTSFKGTPFFTDEDDSPNKPDENRVNAWPLLYYQSPSLSVLWPLFSYGDDRLALRPLFSVYNLDEERREYNVLWPLGQLDRKNRDNRFFPVFWGDDYAAVFPLYWHNGTPSESRGFDALFPLWIFNNAPGPDYSLHLLWPLFNRKHDGPTSGWRLWPLYADWRGDYGDYHGWYAWPLGWRWGDATHHARLLLPLFYQASAPGSSTFASLLGGWHDDARQSWGYLFPLGFHHRDDKAEGWYTLLGGSRTDANGDGFWYAAPALAWGSRSGADRSVWAGGPLFHYGNAGKTASSHLLPLYFKSESPAESLFVSLPYSHHRDARGSWNLVPPVWFHHQDDAGSFSITPLYMWGRDNRTGVPWSAIPPLYYHHEDDGGDTFLSPLLSTWTGAHDTRHTLLPPLLSYYSSGEGRRDLWTLAGLGHLSWGEDRGSSYLFPLYYKNRNLTLSPLWSSWESTDGTRDVRVVPPLLSWLDRDTDSTSLHLLLAWAKFSGGEKPENSWVFPLYYRNPETGTLLSPAYARWTAGHDSATALPLLLSWVDREPDNTSAYLLLGLAKFSGGKEPEDSWVVPLYYRNPASGTFLSLPYARWRENDREGVSIPLLLSGYSESPGERNLWLLLGLYGRSWSTRPGGDSSSWLVPLYASGKDYFLTPLAGRWKSNTTFTYVATPLAGWRSGATRGSWLFPLYSYASDPVEHTTRLWYLPWGHYESRGSSSSSSLFPFYRYENDAWTDEALASETQGRTWNVLYLAAYENRRSPLTEWDRATRQSKRTGMVYHAANRFFPLWSYDRTTNTKTERLEKDFSLLFFLQDYAKKKDLADAPKTDFVRTRVLWRLFRYQRDHDDVTVDVFPAITYDRTGDSMRKASFLWRGFRYERKEGQKAVDLLFLPVWRTAWVH